MKRIALLCTLAVAVAAFPAAAAAKTTISISGSTSVFPLASKLARQYVKENPGKFRFKILQGGSDVGVADVAAGRVSIGNSSRDPKPSDPGGIVFNKISRDALCVATNPANAIATLSEADVQAIFSGQVRDWADVPGAKITGPINIIVRTAASGTQDAFDKIFMGSKKTSSSASQKASNGLIQQTVSSDKNAIGYVSLAFTKGVHAVPYKGVGCTLQNSKSGQYGGARNFWMVTRGAASGAVGRFIRWITRDKDAKRVTATAWVPLS